MATEAYLTGAVRTPIGRRGGALAETRADELLAVALRALVERSGIEPELVEDVQVGCVNALGEQGRNVGRLAALAAGFGPTVPAATINRMCGSSQQAIHAATHAVMAGQQELVIAAGVESMSRIPMGADGQGVSPSPAVTERFELVNQGIAAEMIAERWSISRPEMDEVSVESHRRAARAWADGSFDAETVPVPRDASAFLLGRPAAGTALARDEGIRPDTTVERLAALRPAFRDGGSIHAGNSSQISDGAAAVLIASRGAVERHGLTPRARIVATQVVGVDPVMMLHGVIDATSALLDRCGLSAGEVELYEINEAFASVLLAWERELGVPRERVNVNGGAIALGHPTGCSGARLMSTLLHAMERRDARLGVQAMCIGYGMATATLVERLG
jgi:acetyl-CoA acyltransferase